MDKADKVDMTETRNMTFTKQFPYGFRATLNVSMDGMSCEWSPERPQRLPERQRAALLKSYRTWRDECLAQFAQVHHLTMRTVHTAAGDAIAFSDKE